MAEKIILKVVADTTKANKDIGKVGKGAKEAAVETTLLSGAMASLTGVMTKVKATSKLMFGTIRAGIISTGIGVLVIAFGALIQYFTDSEKGAAKLKKILAPIGVLFGNITDIISTFGEMIFKAFSNPKKAITSLMKMIKTNVINRFIAIGDIASAVGKILKAVFTLDFDGIKEGVGELGESMVQMTTGVDDAFNKANAALQDFAEQTSKEMTAAVKLEEDRLALQIFEREAMVDKAKAESDMMELRLKARDVEKYTTEERLGFMRQANKKADDQLKKDLHVANEKLRMQRLENSFSKSTQENLQAEAELEAEVFRIQKQNFSERKRMKSEEQALVREAEAKEKAERDARRARYKERKKQRETEAGELLKLNQDIELMQIVDADDRAKRALEIQRESALKSVEGKKNSAEQIKAINEKYDLLELDRIKKIEEKKKSEQDKVDVKKEKDIEDSNKKLLELQQANTLLSIEDAQLKADKELEIQEKKELDSVAKMENSEALKAEIVKKYEHIKQKQKEATAKIEQQQNLAAIAGLQGTLGGIAGLHNEGTKKWKALKTGEAMIGTFLGAQKAYTATAGIPVIGPFLAPINAAIAVAAGIAQVKKIQSTEIPKMASGGIVGGYGSSTSDSVNTRLSKGEAVINARSAKMFRGALSSMNVAGGGVSFAGEDDNNSGGGVVKAYVLNDEMTSAQDRTAKIKRRSSI